MHLNVLDFIIDMADNEQLHTGEQSVAVTSRSSNDIRPENSNLNLLQKPLSNSGKSAETIGLEAALKLL